MTSAYGRYASQISSTVKVRLPYTFFKNGVLGFQSRFNFHAENVLVKKILDADAAAGGLILIARADAAVRCADFVFARDGTPKPLSSSM